MCGMFPPEFECDAVLKDGRCVHIRPLNFDEYDCLDDLYQRSSEESLHKRFGWTEAREWLRSIKGCSEDSQICLIAEHQKNGEETEVIGDCWYFVEVGTGSAEVSILVRDDFQNRGLGTQMMELLIRVARAEGIYRLFVLVNMTNHPMTAIVKRLKFSFIHSADASHLYRLDL